ncbi:UNVERIFIED_CONTAM: hypothetical protein RMT77_000456 [Armadillidium vulgare]
MSDMAYSSSYSEELATKRFIERVNVIRQERQLGPLPWNTALKFLMARKFDVERAISLYEQHEDTRQREGLIKLNPAADPLRTELATGKFTILPCRDSTGAAIAVFTARYHNPQSTSHQTTLQGIVYQLDTALESTETQRCGLVFIYDMTGSNYNNFDYALSQKILTLLKGGYPARLKKVLIVTAPLWFRAPFKVLRLFVREKLRERVYTVTSPELVNHIPAQCLPCKLGGSLEVKHEAWLLRCFESMSNRCDIYNEDSVKNLDRPSESGVEETERNLNEKDSTDDFKSSCVDSSEALFEGYISELSEDDESIGKALSYEDLGDDLEESPSDAEADCPLEQRGVPIELSTAEEEKIEGSENQSQLRNIINEVQQEAARVNGHSKDNSLNGDDSLLSSEISDSDTLHSDNEQGYTLKEFVKYLKETGRAGLHYEYSQIKGKPPFGTFHHSRQRWNQLKNRYIDVLCYDHSRVELAAEDEEGHTTYINGNFVDGYKQKNAFISTQGPLPCTFGDFWRMVWEQQVCVIVMTTKTLERGRTKCGQYWPAEQGSSVTHTHFSITNTSVTSETNYIITQLSILDSRTGEERVVEHLQFTSWPDYGVPDSALAMLGFLAKVRESQSKLTASLGKKWDGHPLGPPILVHCSAGIGRTGTFCTLDICIRRLEDVGLIDVRGTVERIRNQRAFSIQMPEQYVFCHLALLEYAISSGKLQEVDLTGFENQSSDSD